MSEIAIHQFKMPAAPATGDIFIESWKNESNVRLVVIGDPTNCFGLVLREMEKCDPPFTAIRLQFEINGQEIPHTSDWRLICMAGVFSPDGKCDMPFEAVCQNTYDTLKRAVHTSIGISALTQNFTLDADYPIDADTIRNFDILITKLSESTKHGSIRLRRECHMSTVEPYATFKPNVRNVDILIEQTDKANVLKWVQDALHMYRDVKAVGEQSA